MSAELTEAIKAQLGSEELAALRDLRGNKWPTGFRDLPDDAMIRVPSEFRKTFRTEGMPAPRESSAVSSARPRHPSRDSILRISRATSRTRRSMPRLRGRWAAPAVSSSRWPLSGTATRTVPGTALLVTCTRPASPAASSPSPRSRPRRHGCRTAISPTCTGWGTRTWKTSRSGSASPGSSCRLGAIITIGDFTGLDDAKVPAGLMCAYRGLIQYGYANGLLR